MSRKYNANKSIKDVLNDRYAHLKTSIQSVVKVLLYPSFGSAKEMAGSSHTPACCLSKLRSSLEAGKKQLRVWLQYGCSVAEVLFDRRSNRVERIWCSERLFHDSNKRNRLLYTHAESVKILYFRHHFGAQSKDYSYLCTVKTN